MVRQCSGCRRIPNGTMGKDTDLDGYKNRIENVERIITMGHLESTYVPDVTCNIVFAYLLHPLTYYRLLV